MSLVSTWVEATDGKMYKNPEFEGDDFFICFDDDDPPEIVIRKTSNRTPWQIFDSLGIFADKVQDRGFSGRCFGRRFKVVAAQSYFFQLLKPIPVPRKFDDSRTLEEFKLKHKQCCYIVF